MLELQFVYGIGWELRTTDKTIQKYFKTKEEALCYIHQNFGKKANVLEHTEQAGLRWSDD